MRKLLGRTRAGDRVVIAVLLLAIAALFAAVGSAPPGSRVLVERGEDVLFSAPLTESHRTALLGPLGKTTLLVKDGQARILDSPCPQKLCVKMGAVRRSGELLACVPNRILVRVTGNAADRKEPSYDLLSR